MVDDRQRTDLVQGTLDMLILKTLGDGPMHGYAVARRIQQTSDGILQVEEGSLYPALHRIERRGWIEAEWGNRSRAARTTGPFFGQLAFSAKETSLRKTWTCPLLPRPGS